MAGNKAARFALEDGITNVRDVGCRHLGIYALRDSLISVQVSGFKQPVDQFQDQAAWRFGEFTQMMDL